MRYQRYTHSMPVAVIADIVGSRRLAQRDEAQRVLDETIGRVERAFPLAVEPMRPIAGDEEQGVYPALEAAMAAILLQQLALPDGLECRYGIGIGPIRTIDSAERTISEGPGWWAARAAIDEVHARQRRTVSSARTWVVASPEENADMQTATRLANASLIARDEIVARLSERQRRLAYGRCLGTTQRELAAQEGIGQSAVSQALARSGADAIVAAFALLTAGMP